jgi:hypothetical protein
VTEREYRHPLPLSQWEMGEGARVLISTAPKKRKKPLAHGSGFRNIL